MKKLIGWADGYLKECTWRDMALLKFCLGSLGVLIGLQVPKKRKKTAAWTAGTAAASRISTSSVRSPPLRRLRRLRLRRGMGSSMYSTSRNDAIAASCITLISTDYIAGCVFCQAVAECGL